MFELSKKKPIKGLGRESFSRTFTDSNGHSISVNVSGMSISIEGEDAFGVEFYIDIDKGGYYDPGLYNVMEFDFSMWKDEKDEKEELYGKK